MKAMLFLGCSGEGGWVIETSYRIACYGAIAAAIVAVALFFVEWRRTKLAWWPLYVPLLVIHPGWRMWRAYLSGILPVSSDCGYGSRFLSLAISTVLVVMLLLRLFRPGFSRRFFLALLAASCWLLYVAAAVLFQPPFSAVFPLSWATSAWFQETVETIDFGRLRMWSFMIIVTVVSVLLYLPWRRRRQNAV